MDDLSVSDSRDASNLVASIETYTAAVVKQRSPTAAFAILRENIRTLTSAFVALDHIEAIHFLSNELLAQTRLVDKGPRPYSKAAPDSETVKAEARAAKAQPADGKSNVVPFSETYRSGKTA